MSWLNYGNQRTTRSTAGASNEPQPGSSRGGAGHPENRGTNNEVLDNNDNRSGNGTEDEDEEPINMTFEDENAADKTNALSEALKTLSNHKFDTDDLHFTLNQMETRMAAAGVKKQFTKLQVLATTLPPHIIKQVKPILRKSEAEFENNDAYKQLKTTIIRIFGPKKDDRMKEALSLVLTDKPSELARELVDKVCKKNLQGCECCPDIILCLWKRHLSSQVRAGIAKMEFNENTFEEIVQLADDIHQTTRAPRAIAAVAAPESLDETQPAIPYAQPEVAAVRGSGRGGRGGNNRGWRGGGRGSGRGGGGRGSSNSGQNNGQSQGQGQGGSQGGQRGGRRGARHADGPPDSACSMHFRWGRSANFCTNLSHVPGRITFSQDQRIIITNEVLTSSTRKLMIVI